MLAKSKTLYAFYDLEVAPATFDIVKFLVLAEVERQEIGCDKLHVVILPGSDDGFRAGDLRGYQKLGADYDIGYMGWRLRNILIPCCWLMPSCEQVTVFTSREEAGIFEQAFAGYVFPKGYRVCAPIGVFSERHINIVTARGTNLPTLRATPQALVFANQWLQSRAGGRKVVTLTLRESPYERDRNSNIKAWGDFARGLDPVYYPIIVRDTDATLELLPPELEGLTSLPEVPWNVELRAAFYELAYLNMFTSSGASGMCWYLRLARFMIFKLITPSCGATSERYFRVQGIKIGSQMGYMTPFQRLVWEDDTYEVIQREFEYMCQRIEG